MHVNNFKFEVSPVFFFFLLRSPLGFALELCYSDLNYSGHRSNLKVSCHDITSVLLISMFEINSIVFDRVVAEKSCAFETKSPIIGFTLEF